MSGQFKQPFQGPEEPDKTPLAGQGLSRPPAGFPPVIAQSTNQNNQLPAQPGGPGNQFPPVFNPNSQLAPQVGGPGNQLPPPGFNPYSQRPQQGYVQGRYGQYGPGQLPPHTGPGTGQLPPPQPAPGMDQPGSFPPGPSFGMQQTPPVPGLSGQSVPPQGVSGPYFPAGPLNRAGMSGSSMPNAAWNNRLASASSFNNKELPLSDRARGKRNRKKRRVPIWARVVISLLTLVIVLLGGGYWYYQTNYASVLSSVTGKTVTRANGEVDPNAGKSGNVLNWGRINILLLGSDTDEKPAWGAGQYLAQTDIVVSIDTTTHEVDMLSFPRDFWLNIPGYGMGKLDMAFSDGGSLSHNMSGVDASRQTFQDDFGVPINFYAWVGLNGFVNVVNTVGGVDVDVTHPVVDDNYPDDVNNKSGDVYAYEGIYIPDGPQHLDGPTALEYVRSRHADLNGDFGRSARQQQVLDALKLKLNNPSIISELPQIAKDLQGSVYTDMDTTKIFELMDFARGITASQIKHLTLGGGPYTQAGTVTLPGIGTEDVEFPQCGAIAPAINSFLHITTGKCDITGDTGQGSSQLASAQEQQAPLVASGPSVAGAQLADIPSAGLQDTISNLFGLRDILDLMSMVLLDSPQV